MEIDNLKESLSQYEAQLIQVIEAIKISPKGDEFDSLISLKSDLEELINLTNENISRLNVQNKSSKHDDTIDDEYALFMAEMTKSGAYDDTDQEKNEDESPQEQKIDDNDVDIEEELSSLEGLKCAVLYSNNDGEPSLCNAMVCSVIRDNPDNNTKFHTIQVRVMFTNPTHIEMIPCPYYLGSECKFDDETCKYSHGEVFPLSSLQEAVEPIFSSIKIGSKVLAKIKQKDGESYGKSGEKHLLWHRAIVTSVHNEKHLCSVKLENNSLLKSGGKNDYTVDFGEIFPLVSNADSTDSSDDSDNDELNNTPGTSQDDSYFVEKSLTNTANSSVKLGDWEKHTRGIGSKLMIKMGYVIGNGLGIYGDGIMEPIPCRVLPTGRSLDHCMILREETEIDDPIKAEKKLKRIQKKQEEKERKAQERAKAREQHTVFNFLNHTLSNKAQSSNSSNEPDSESSTRQKIQSNIKSSTCKNLNIEHLKLAEDIKKVERDIVKLKNSILRNKGSADVQRGLSVKLNSKLSDIQELQLKENRITNEQNLRKDKKKLTIF